MGSAARPNGAVSLCFAFLRSRFLVADAGEPCCNNGLLKAEAVAAINLAKEMVAATNAAFAAQRFDILSDAIFSASLRMPIDKRRSWLRNVEMIMRFLCRTLVDHNVQSVVTLADEVSKVTPKYDHVATSDKVHTTLAKRHLLGWPSKEALNAKTILLHQALAGLRGRHAEWQLSPALVVDPAWKEELESVDVIFDSAKMAIATMAAVNILINLKGPAQVDQASQFLTKNRDQVPKSLATALDNIVTTAAEVGEHKKVCVCPLARSQVHRQLRQ